MHNYAPPLGSGQQYDFRIVSVDTFSTTAHTLTFFKHFSVALLDPSLIPLVVWSTIRVMDYAHRYVTHIPP